MAIHKINTETLELYLDEENILHLKILEGAEVTLEYSKMNLKIAEKITQRQNVCVLVDARANFTLSKEAREHAAKSPTLKFWIALAIVTNLLANRLIINFFIKAQKPSLNARVFSSETEALTWLRTFKK